MSTASSHQFSFGDRVVHRSKPEWGEGVVTAVAAATHEGEPCQRVTLRFERAGLKTLLTAVADLRPAGEHEAPAAAVAAARHDQATWLDQAEARDLPILMARLPEETRDPFLTLTQRLKATLALYRFTGEGGSLLDWAAAQTGLADPLSHFSRHELESFFQRYASARDEHLRSLVLTGMKQEPAVIAAVAREGDARQRAAMQRVYQKR